MLSLLFFSDWGFSRRWWMIPVQLLEGGSVGEGAERVDPKVNRAAPSTVWQEDNYTAESVTVTQMYKSADKRKHEDGGKIESEIPCLLEFNYARPPNLLASVIMPSHWLSSYSWRCQPFGYWLYNDGNQRNVVYFYRTLSGIQSQTSSVCQSSS